MLAALGAELVDVAVGRRLHLEADHNVPVSVAALGGQAVAVRIDLGAVRVPIGAALGGQHMNQPRLFEPVAAGRDEVP
jgi:hypothetical protein